MRSQTTNKKKEKLSILFDCRFSVWHQSLYATIYFIYFPKVLCVPCYKVGKLGYFLCRKMQLCVFLFFHLPTTLTTPFFILLHLLPHLSLFLSLEHNFLQQECQQQRGNINNNKSRKNKNSDEEKKVE